MNKYDYTIQNILDSLKQVGLKKGDNVFTYSNLGFFGKLKNAETSEDYCAAFRDAIFKIIGKRAKRFIKKDDYLKKTGETKFQNYFDWIRRKNIYEYEYSLGANYTPFYKKYLDENISMVTYGDGVSDINIKKLVEFHKSHRKTITITGVHPPARFGELIEKDGRVISFEEKPQVSVGLINGGFMVFNRKLMDYLTEDCDFEFGPLEKLAKSGDVMVYKHMGEWECMDHERDVVHLNKLWNEKKAFWKVW